MTAPTPDPRRYRTPTGRHARRLLERIARPPAAEENLTPDEARVAGLVAMDRAERPEVDR